MITKNEIEPLRGLTNQKPYASKLEASDKILLYAEWFILELAKDQFDPEFKDWEDANEEVISWREKIPPEDGDYAQAARWTNPKDETALIKLIADSGVALVHPSIYNFVMKVLPEPEFRVFEGLGAIVAIHSTGVRVGGVAQVRIA